jgi:hypothetical protein
MDCAMVETYLRVFRAIFTKSKHAAHYEMMMGDAFMPDSAQPTATPANIQN